MNEVKWGEIMKVKYEAMLKLEITGETDVTHPKKALDKAVIDALKDEFDSGNVKVDVFSKIKTEVK